MALLYCDLESTHRSYGICDMSSPSQENCAPKELYDFVHGPMGKTGPSPSAPVHYETPAPAIKLLNNDYPQGTCAGCRADDGEDGGATPQCARCEGGKYCGRACQKLDWHRHKPDCVEE